MEILKILLRKKKLEIWQHWCIFSQFFLVTKRQKIAQKKHCAQPIF
jgi:hypothetical protein